MSFDVREDSLQPVVRVWQPDAWMVVESPEQGQALADLWVFIVAPFAGAVIAAGIWKAIGEE